MSSDREFGFFVLRICACRATLRDVQIVWWAAPYIVAVCGYGGQLAWYLHMIARYILIGVRSCDDFYRMQLCL